MNSMLAIHPYKHEGLWVFDDEKVGLVQEPFVSGADIIIETIVQDIPNANEGFTLIFSAQPFPGHQAKFDWVREDSGGNWYRKRCRSDFNLITPAPLLLNGKQILKKHEKMLECET